MKFINLFRQALLDWPVEIDLTEIQHATPDLGRYIVKGLSDVSDEIEDKYIGSEMEVLLCNLHTAIYTVVLAAAKYVVSVEMSSIRPEAVRLVFERRLQYERSANDLNWQTEDYDLVDLYFAQNTKHKKTQKSGKGTETNQKKINPRRLTQPIVIRRRPTKQNLSSARSRTKTRTRVPGRSPR